MPCQAGADHFRRSKCPIDEQVRWLPKSAIKKTHCRTNPTTRPVQPSLHLIQRSGEAHRPSDDLRASPRTHSHSHSRPGARPRFPQPTENHGRGGRGRDGDRRRRRAGPLPASTRQVHPLPGRLID